MTDTDGPAAAANDAGNAPELSVIVPCLNEELNLPELTARTLATFDRGGFWGELVIVDDGSSDSTPEVIRTLSAAHPREVVGVFHPVNKGIAAGWRSGAIQARGRLVATIDADLQYQPEDLLRLRRALYEHSVDVAQGYRSPVGRRRDERYTLSRGFNALLNGVFSMSLRDNKSGFVMCAREVLLDLLSFTGNYYYWQSFIMIAAHAKGYSYREVETLFEERRQGTSFLAGSNALKASARSFVDLAKATWEYRVRSSPVDSAGTLTGRRARESRAPNVQEASSSPLWRAYMATFNQTHFMITRDVERQHEIIKKTEWMSRVDLEALADEKLRRVVRHAYRNVPYYRARMQEIGLRPDDVRGRGDLSKLPLLTKASVRANLYFDILSEDHDKDAMLRVTTSGGHGEPFVFFSDRSQLELRWAAELRAREWTGYRFGDATVRLWDASVGLGPSHPLRERTDARLANRTLVPLYDLSKKNFVESLGVIRAAKPAVVEGSAEVLDLLARFALSENATKPLAAAVLTSGQTLTADSRRTIEAALGASVFDLYGSRELGLVAHECDAHAGHHIVSEAHIVEILVDGREAKPGEMGEIVVTDLSNYCMPFLRYRTGDFAIAIDRQIPCICGRSSPRIEKIEGREQAIIVGTDGRYLPGSFFAHYLKDFDFAIQRYQILQERKGAMTLRIRKAGRYSDDVLGEILATFKRRLGSDMSIDVELATGPSLDVLDDDAEPAVKSDLSRPFLPAW